MKKTSTSIKGLMSALLILSYVGVAAAGPMIQGKELSHQIVIDWEKGVLSEQSASQMPMGTAIKGSKTSCSVTYTSDGVVIDWKNKFAYKKNQIDANKDHTDSEYGNIPQWEDEDWLSM